MNDSELLWLAGDPENLALTDVFAAANYRASVNISNYGHWFIFYDRVLMPITLLLMICVGASVALISLEPESIPLHIVKLVLLGVSYKICADFIPPLAELFVLDALIGALLPLTFPTAFIIWVKYHLA